VVCPCWRGEVYCWLGLGELGEEEGAEVDCARTTDGLEAGCSAFFNCQAVGAKNELLGCESELRKTGDGKVFVVEVGVISDQCICLSSSLAWAYFGTGEVYLLDHGQYPGLRIVVSVSANTQIDFLVELVPAVCCHQAEEGVLCSLWTVILGEACC